MSAPKRANRKLAGPAHRPRPRSPVQPKEVSSASSGDDTEPERPLDPDDVHLRLLLAHPPAGPWAPAPDIQISASTSALLVLVSLVLACLSAGADHSSPLKETAVADSPLYSPSPRQFVALMGRACEADLAKLGRHELLRLYGNASEPGSGRLRRFIETHRMEHECRRERTAWRYQYIDETGDVRLRDDTIDERLANVAYSTRSDKAFAIDSLVFDSGDPAQDEHNMRLVAGPHVSDELCGQQMRQMLELVDDLERLVRARRSPASTSELARARPLTDQHISVAKLLDSFGRYESGHLLGRLLAIGSYEQCRTNRLIVNETHQLPMRFCWANLALTRHLAPSLRARPHDSYETALNVLSVSVCLPRACHSRSFAKLRPLFQELTDSQIKLPASMYVDETLPLHSLYCLPDPDSAYRMPLMGRCLVGFLVLWFLLAVLVTFRNGRRRRLARQYSAMCTGALVSAPPTAAPVEQLNRNRKSAANLQSPLDCLDLRESWREFMRVREPSAKPQTVELATLDMVKVSGCAFVVLAHSFALFVGFAMDQIYTSRVMEDDPIVQIFVAGTLIVDTFFAITGILWAYFTLKRFHKTDARDLNQTDQRVHLEPDPSVGHAARADVAPAKSNGASVMVQFDRQLQQDQPQNQNQRRKDEAPVAGRLPTDGVRYFAWSWFSLASARYLRILPLFVIAHWFKKFVYSYTASGPLWDYGFNAHTFIGSCRLESMWTPFTIASAYLPLSHQCILQSWSISNDLFFALIGPPLIWLIYKRPKWALVTAASLTIMSFVNTHRAVYSLPAHLDEEVREFRSFGFYRLFDKMSTFYTAPHHRVSCFLVGLWGGYQLFKRQLEAQAEAHCGAHLATTSPICHTNATPELRRRAPRIKWPGWLRGPATFLATFYIIMMFVAFINHRSIKNHANSLYRLMYPEFISSFRTLWALSNVVLFIRMVTDWKDNFWMRFAGARFWQVTSKLNYAMLLIHMDFLLFTLQISVTPPLHMTTWAFCIMGGGALLFCLPLTLFINVVYENTIDKLTRTLLPIH